MASKVENFLDAAGQERIVEAIRLAERQTSGEIRVHLEATCTGNAYERAQELFHLLKMDNTKEENGILLYLAVDSRKFAVIGDRGIHLKVHDAFWQQVKDVMEVRFRESAYTTGLVEGIQLVGKQLAAYFPWDVDDVNELPNEITTS
jgi:uncharacterized membrane protein